MPTWSIRRWISRDLSRRFRAVCLVILAANAGVPTAALTVGRAVEPPPERYASGPTLSGKTWEMVLKDPAQVNYFCSLAMGEPPQRGAYWMGCYRPDLDAVVLMEKSAWPDASEWDQLRAHEWAHARGWRHAHTSTGWTGH